jgi:hypothetical protein
VDEQNYIDVSYAAWEKKEGRRVKFFSGEVRWYWSFGEVEVEESDHGCGPDCCCFKKEK